MSINIFYLQKKGGTKPFFMPQHFRAIQLLGHHFNAYYETASVAYSQVIVLSLIVCCMFGLIRFSNLTPLLPKILMFSTCAATSTILYVECIISDLTKPCTTLFRIYAKSYYGQKQWITMLKSFRPLKLKLGYNFAYPRRYLYLVVLFRLSRLLNTMLLSYPQSQITYESIAP